MLSLLFALLVSAAMLITVYRIYQLLMAMTHRSYTEYEFGIYKTLEEAFEYHMAQLKEINSKTYEWVKSLDEERGEKYKTYAGVYSILIIAMIIVSPIYLIVSLLGLLL